MGVRAGTPSDIEPVVEVILSAMPLDPQWDWRFPYRHEYPEDNYKYTKMLFEYFLDPGWDDWIVMVVDAPSIEDPKIAKIVAFSVWDISYINIAKYGPAYEPQNPMREVSKRGGATRRDANPARMKAFREAGDATKEEYFDSVYGIGGQMPLQILGTHVDYMRHGHGSALCNWGMTKARDDGVAVTLIASPMGVLLYTHLGFRHVGKGVIKVPGDNETNAWDAMDYDPKCHVQTELKERSGRTH